MNQIILEAGHFAKIERGLIHIDRYPITEIRSTIEKLAQALGEKKGGVLRIIVIDSRDGSSTKVFAEPFGIFDNPGNKNRRLFEASSKEKATRLQKHCHHHSSHESRKPDKKLYGGAIRTKNRFIISCSGMSESEDEALALCLAVHLNWLDENEAEKIANKSGNKNFKRLMKTMK